MHALIEKLIKEGPVVTDGSWGTQLQNRGLKRGECPDSWNLSHPERVEEVARQYVEAGSQIILTNTFGGNRLSLGRFNMGDKAVAINTAGVEISKKAAGNRAAVFASIGPTGKLLLTKETTEEELQNTFEEQADAQARAGRNTTRYLALYHTRLSGPLTVLLFAFLALPLGFAVGPSRSLAASALSGIVLLATYYTARTAAELLAQKGFAWAVASPWLIFAVFSGYGVWQLRRVAR